MDKTLDKKKSLWIKKLDKTVDKKIKNNG